MIGWGACGDGMMWYKQSIFEKKEKTKKTILSPFKPLKILWWYSCTILWLDALRTALKCLKTDFTVVCMVAKMCKGSKIGSKRVKLE